MISGHWVSIGLREKQGHYLIVAYDVEGDDIVVVTVIDVSRNLNKIIERKLKAKRWVEI